MLLEGRGLSHTYPGPVCALTSVDLSINCGELVCVLGPNGSGKSTLLKTLAQLVTATGGSTAWQGQPMGELTSRERARRVAFVPQSLTTLPEVTVRDFVAQGRYSHQGAFSRPTTADREAVERALAQSDLSELAGRPLPELSGGQRQRSLVARALAQESKLLLIDEPTNALDPEHQIAVFELIESLIRQERAVIVVTHDLNLASQYATRIVLLNGGRKVADGSVGEVLQRSILEPVYGPGLMYSTWTCEESEGEGPAEDKRPLILPKRRS